MQCFLSSIDKCLQCCSLCSSSWYSIMLLCSNTPDSTYRLIAKCFMRFNQEKTNSCESCRSRYCYVFPVSDLKSLSSTVIPDHRGVLLFIYSALFRQNGIKPLDNVDCFHISTMFHIVFVLKPFFAPLLLYKCVILLYTPCQMPACTPCGPIVDAVTCMPPVF